jgi:hypothetical protein
VDVGKALPHDIASRSEEAALAEIDRFIAKRSQALKVENRERAQQEAWDRSTREANEKRREQARLEWHLHHTTQAQRLRNTLEALIEHHEEKAEKLAPLGSGGDAA